MERGFTAEQIARHADKLPAHYHDVLSAAIGNDMRKIGELLGIPVGTVKSRLHRGRLRLADLVAAEERKNAKQF